MISSSGMTFFPRAKPIKLTPFGFLRRLCICFISSSFSLKFGLGDFKVRNGLFLGYYRICSSSVVSSSEFRRFLRDFGFLGLNFTGSLVELSGFCIFKLENVKYSNEIIQTNRSNQIRQMKLTAE